MQEKRYPDPEQLREWASDPTPFHELSDEDLSVGEDGSITAHVDELENVLYVYKPEYINVDDMDEQVRKAESVEWFDLSHREAWNDAIDLSFGEDYISTTGTVMDSRNNPTVYEAFWLLKLITIETNSTKD